MEIVLQFAIDHGWSTLSLVFAPQMLVKFSLTPLSPNEVRS